MSFAISPKAKGDEEKMARRPPAPARGGPDADPPPRPADGRAAALRPVADARRGRRRPAQEPLRRRRRAAPAARPVPRDDPQGVARAGPLQEADGRPRAVRRLPHRARADGRGAASYEFVDKIVGGVIPQGFRPAVDKGIQEAMQHGELAGAPVKGVRVRARGRLVPLGRLLGDGVQDCRLDGVQVRLREGRPGAARADHGGRGDRAGRRRRRGQRRPQLAAWPAARAWSRAAA